MKRDPESELSKNEDEAAGVSIPLGNLQSVLQMVDDTKAAADVAVELVSDLLLYDRLEEGGLELAKMPVRIWSVVKECMQLFKIQVNGCPCYRVACQVIVAGCVPD